MVIKINDYMYLSGYCVNSRTYTYPNNKIREVEEMLDVDKIRLLSMLEKYLVGNYELAWKNDCFSPFYHNNFRSNINKEIIGATRIEYSLVLILSEGDILNLIIFYSVLPLEHELIEMIWRQLIE